MFFDEVLEEIGSKNGPKSDAKIDANSMQKTNGPKMLKK